MKQSISLQKEKLRQHYKAAIKNIPLQDQQQIDRGIYQNLINWPAFTAARNIFCYVGGADEINTRPIIERALVLGQQVAVPKCFDKGHMQACLIQNLAQLSVQRYGIAEPQEPYSVLAKTEIELILIPCLAVDHDGFRLGYGGGYYDRYLSDTNPNQQKVVLCRHEFVVTVLPHDSFDVKADIIITEKDIITI